jgi:phage gp37-like protein
VGRKSDAPPAPFVSYGVAGSISPVPTFGGRAVKKVLGTVVAIAGAVVVAWAGASLLVTQQRVYGYDPVYAGLAGLVPLVGGLLARQD